MFMHPKKSSWLPDRALCAICLKNLPKPLTPLTSFNLLTASNTEDSSSWSLYTHDKQSINGRLGERKKHKTTRNEIIPSKRKTIDRRFRISAVAGEIRFRRIWKPIPKTVPNDIKVTVKK